MGYVADNLAVYLTLWPDWADGIRVKYAWQTGILTGRTGKEQRSAYRSKAMKSLSFNLNNLSFAESAWLLRNVQRNISSPWGVPFWPEGIALSAQAAAGQKVLQFTSDLTDRDFVAGDSVILLDPDLYTTYEAGVIASIDLVNYRITLVSNLVLTWAAAKWVCPLIPGYIQKEDISYETSEYSGCAITVNPVMTGVTS